MQILKQIYSTVSSSREKQPSDMRTKAIQPSFAARKLELGFQNLRIRFRRECESEKKNIHFKVYEKISLFILKTKTALFISFYLLGSIFFADHKTFHFTRFFRNLRISIMFYNSEWEFRILISIKNFYGIMYTNFGISIVFWSMSRQWWLKKAFFLRLNAIFLETWRDSIFLFGDLDCSRNEL